MDPVRGWRRAISAAKQGTPEERLERLTAVRTTFDALVADYREHAAPDPETEQRVMEALAELDERLAEIRELLKGTQ